MKKKVKNGFSLETIKRLGLYLRNLKQLRQQGIEIISSDKITQLLNASSAQFRKDLSYFGGFGKPGVGYQVSRLIKEIEIILGVNKECKIVMVGVGKLGSALLGFEGFSELNLKIAYAFDSDKDKIGKKRKGIKIEDIREIKRIVQSNNIKIAIISTPPEAAQTTAESLIQAGVKGILNFAPIILKTAKGVSVSNVDMACELESLIFFSTRKN